MVDNDRMQIADCRLEIEENTRYLQGIVDLCNTHNVKPVVVLMPVMAEYKRQLPVEQVALYQTVLQTMDSVATCLDASDWEIPEEGWYNATHLTKESSESFTQQLLLENK